MSVANHMNLAAVIVGWPCMSHTSRVADYENKLWTPPGTAGDSFHRAKSRTKLFENLRIDFQGLKYNTTACLIPVISHFIGGEMNVLYTFLSNKVSIFSCQIKFCLFSCLQFHLL